LAHVPTLPKTAFMGAQSPINLKEIITKPDPEEPATLQLAKMRTDGQNGDVDAQSQLGNIYYFGEGVPVDWHEAQGWFRKAAERGRPEAQTKLGVMYFMGQGIPRDIPESVKWFRQAAAQGETSAQVCIGAMYAQGVGVSQDLVEAYTWFLQALAGGNASAVKSCLVIEKLLTPRQIQEGHRRAAEAIRMRGKAQIMAGD
jgi:TPR repeat protein